MANFVAIIDRDPQRRAAFMQRVAPRLAPIAGLSTDRATIHDLSVMWATSHRAPRDHHISDRSALFLWGIPVDPDSGRTVDAKAVHDRWQGAPQVPFAFDGYYAALFYERDGFVLASVDLLGLFPLYYAARDTTLIVSATPDVFRAHPQFPVSLDTSGLAAVMLARAPIEGRTLLRDVNRLRAQHALVWQPRSGAVQSRQFFVPLDERTQKSFDDDVAELDTAIDDALRRQTAAASHHGILLSGGRDSRMLAGYLSEHQKTLHALTLGEPDDFESQCARPVARALGLPHEMITAPEQAFVAGARLQSRVEHLMGGMGNVFMWGVLDDITRLPSTIVLGHLADSVLAGKTPRTDSQHFDSIFPRLTQLTLQAEVLAGILRPDSSGAIDEAKENIRRAFETASAPSPQRGWMFQLLNSERCVVGSIPWRISFASWPIIPVLDRALLETVGRLPALSLARRRAQDAILVRRFPHLAKLPVVAANARTIRPLHASLATRVRWRVATKASDLWQRVARPPLRERRYNYRMYDFDGPGWIAVRREAEPFRERLASLFDMDALRSYLPPPDVPLRAPHPIFDTLGRKLIVGLMLWSEDHLG